MRLLLDVILPLLIAAIGIGVLSYIINVLLRLIGFDVFLVKIALFFVAWYFIGPVIYKILLNSMIVYEKELVTFIYEPIQLIMKVLKI